MEKSINDKYVLNVLKSYQQLVISASVFIDLGQKINGIKSLKELLKVFADYDKKFDFLKKNLSCLRVLSDLSRKKLNTQNLLTSTLSYYRAFLLDQKRVRTSLASLKSLYNNVSDNIDIYEDPDLLLKNIQKSIAILSRFLDFSKQFLMKFVRFFVDLVIKFIVKQAMRALINLLLPILPFIIAFCFCVILLVIVVNSFKDDPVGSFNKYCPGGTCSSDMVQFLRNRAP